MYKVLYLFKIKLSDKIQSLLKYVAMPTFGNLFRVVGPYKKPPTHPN